ncbi:HAD family hydrolase [Caproiciproducens faecalis]|uniref:HAD family phosphatase n=1 Tax=Caproiciproducens faecalis TaxID=2820301 RepID=A0ABS7DKD9_9FIRM|nr:HAD family phosphatase [Caproiciproducens faecalis]MBW7571766.1 HAD family phosphatase [Caproiciproducens faecalis]
MIKAVVLDMDGTMFDTERLCAEGWKKAGEVLGCGNVMELIEQAMGVSAAAERELFLTKYGPDFPFDEFRKISADYSKDYIQKNGVPVKEGLTELLDYLKREGYKIAVATSSSRSSTMSHFERTKLTGYFDQIICGDMLEKSKPDPDIYLKAAQALQVSPQECMALEDSPNGIFSAYRAGMKTVMIPDTVPSNPELEKMLFACVPTLHGVIQLLKNWE